jgi:hypothetical protein
MIRYIAVFTFLLIVGVCSYVLLSPGSYSTLVLCLAGFVLSVAILAVAPVWKLFLLVNETGQESATNSPRIERLHRQS